MRKSHGRLFLVTQLFVVSFAQHAMLVGLTMPLQLGMAGSGAELNRIDLLAVALCVTGIVTGAVADNQLFTYMAIPPEAKPLVLDTGEPLDVRARCVLLISP